MKILQINKFLYRQGGTETYLLALIDLLKCQGQKVICFSQKNRLNLPTEEEPYFIDNLDLSGFSFQTLWRLPRLFWSFKARRLVRKLIADRRPDLVHIHNIYHQISPSILPIFKQAGIPVVMTVHDFKLITPTYALRADGAVLRHKNSRLANFILKLEFAWQQWLDIYRRNIDLYIAPSNFVKNKLIEAGFEASKIIVIGHFLTPEFAANGRAAAKQPAQADRYLLAYGRLDESKGFDDLIKAYAEINIAGLKLKIAGSGPEQKNLEKLIGDLQLAGRVELLGQKTRIEIIDLIGGSKAVVNCSKVHETFGLTVLEAMALGKPILASKVGAIPELIKDGDNGLLYQAGDIGDLKRQLQRLAGDKDLRERLGRRARLTASAYSEKKHLAALLDAYSQAAANSKKPIRFINNALINLTAAIAFILLLIIPFYYINIKNGLALVSSGPAYPRLANLYWKNPVTLSDARDLAKWDLLVLDMQAQTNSAEAIREIRRLNPDAIILAYTSANEMPVSRLAAVEPSGAGLWHKLAAGDQPVWHLKTCQGEDIVFWPGNIMMNLGVKDAGGRTYADYLVDFYDREIMSSGLWDGFFFDNAWQTVTQVSQNIDIDADGRADSAAKINQCWQDSYREFFRLLRARLGPRAIIIGNGDGAYQDYLNGRMFEGFPEYWEGGWTGSIKCYQAAADGFKPRINLINSDTSNTGNKYDYQSMRFGLASALLFDGYYSFDYGTQLREQLWWYDEYDADLGEPSSPAKNLLSASTAIQTGVWQRDFSRGLVLINSTDRPQTIDFDAEYEKLRGSQDRETNSGLIINRITLPAQDGIILLKPASDIFDNTFTNGAFARIFDASGQVKRTGFFAYLPSYAGGANISRADLNGDGRRETLVADRNALRLYDQNNLWLKTIYPYGEKYSDSINLAVSPALADAKREIIIAPQTGGANLIRVFDHNLEFSGRQFNAYSRAWPNLGASVTACDTDSDGNYEIITGAGPSGGPHVKIFGKNNELIAEWFAYGLNFRGGVNVACGDINGDGQAEIITGAGPSGGPHVRVYNGTGKLLSQWFAYDSNKRQGVRVTAADVDNDGRLEAVALNINVFGK